MSVVPSCGSTCLWEIQGQGIMRLSGGGTVQFTCDARVESGGRMEIQSAGDVITFNRDLALLGTVPHLFLVPFSWLLFFLLVPKRMGVGMLTS